MNGVPPTWARKPGFSSLVQIILEQAVSLESARSVYEKCEKEIGVITPENFINTEDQVFRKIGFSRMKLYSCREAAKSVDKNNMLLEPETSAELREMESTLKSIPGIGQWTIDIYNLLVLQKPDIWPLSDRALLVAVSSRNGSGSELTKQEFLSIAENWRPFRSWAARIFWHDYLIRRKRTI
jgi:DNA-3-methyladenine glycosylase II